MTDALTLTPHLVTQTVVHIIDGAQLDNASLPSDGILLVHALSPAQCENKLGGRVLGFSSCARLSPDQLAPLHSAAAAHAGDHGDLPETALSAAMDTLRDALLRALADSGLSFALTAASRRFGVCLHLASDSDAASLNAAGLGLGVWSLRCQQTAHAAVLGTDARAAKDIDYRYGSGEEGLPAISIVCGERVVSGTSAWLALSVRGAALADPAMAGTKRGMLEALLRALTTEVVPSWDGRRARLFRAEALAAQTEDTGHLPLQLLLAPSWTRRGVRLLAAGLLLLIAALFVPVRDRLGTTAILGLDGLTTISAMAPGRVMAVSVTPGQHVAADAALLQLNDSAAAAEAERAYADYVALLRRRLAHTDAAAADPALAQAWERLQQARSAAQPWLHAPKAGLVLDVNAAQGQPVAASEHLLLLAPDDSEPQLDLSLPSRAAARLHSGASGSVRLASLPEREFAIRIIWIAQTFTTSASDMAPRVHARATFVEKPPPALLGTSADVRIDLGVEPLFRLLYQRLRGS